MSKPQTLRQFFSNSNLERLIARAHALSELDQRLQRHLPQGLAGHIKVANVRDGILVLQAPSAEWRTRFHFFGPRLLELLRTEVPEITDVRIRVALHHPVPGPARSQGLKLSAGSADVVAKTAEATPDADLRRALAKLAARCR